jgi:hypothetical protein
MGDENAFSIFLDICMGKRTYGNIKSIKGSDSKLLHLHTSIQPCFPQVTDSVDTLIGYILGFSFDTDSFIADSSSRYTAATNDIKANILQYARDNGLDCSKCSLLTQYRKNGIKFVNSLIRRGGSVESKSLFGSFISNVLESVRMNTFAMNSFKKFLVPLGLLSESELQSVRFVATVVMVILLPAVSGSVSLYSSNEYIIDRIRQRTSDRIETIRRVASLDGICRLWSESDSAIDSHIFGLTLRGLFSDPSKHLRLSSLRFLEREISTNLARVRLLSSTIGTAIFHRCFDVEDAVAAVAVRILSKPGVGEVLLSDNDSAFQSISNLMWGPSINSGFEKSGGPDVFQVSREIMHFVDRHILAAPGVISDQTCSEQKLAMISEFLEHYTDGCFSTLVPSFAATFFIFCQKEKTTNFLLDSEAFRRVLESRSRTDSSRGRVVLELLLSTASILPPPDRNLLLCADLKLVIFKHVSEVLDSEQGSSPFNRTPLEIVMDIAYLLNQNGEDECEAPIFSFDGDMAVRPCDLEPRCIKILTRLLFNERSSSI